MVLLQPRPVHTDQHIGRTRSNEWTCVAQVQTACEHRREGARALLQPRPVHADQQTGEKKNGATNKPASLKFRLRAKIGAWVLLQPRPVHSNQKIEKQNGTMNETASFQVQT